MSEWIDVPVAEVQIGDEVRLDGFGSQGTECLPGDGFNLVHDVRPSRISVGPSLETFRRSSIVAVRRRKPEPSPKPGDWRHGVECTSQITGRPIQNGEKWVCVYPEVYRASGGWSMDTRTGQPWVMKEFGQASATVPIVMGSICYSLRKLADDISQGPPIAKGEPLADYYRRIGLDVRPADRRGKR